MHVLYHVSYKSATKLLLSIVCDALKLDYLVKQVEQNIMKYTLKDQAIDAVKAVLLIIVPFTLIVAVIPLSMLISHMIAITISS